MYFLAAWPCYQIDHIQCALDFWNSSCVLFECDTYQSRRTQKLVFKINVWKYLGFLWDEHQNSWGNANKQYQLSRVTRFDMAFATTRFPLKYTWKFFPFRSNISNMAAVCLHSTFSGKALNQWQGRIWSCDLRVWRHSWILISHVISAGILKFKGFLILSAHFIARFVHICIKWWVRRAKKWAKRTRIPLNF